MHILGVFLRVPSLFSPLGFLFEPQKTEVFQINVLIVLQSIIYSNVSSQVLHTSFNAKEPFPIILIHDGMREKSDKTAFIFQENQGPKLKNRYDRNDTQPDAFHTSQSESSPQSEGRVLASTLMTEGAVSRAARDAESLQRIKARRSHLCFFHLDFHFFFSACYTASRCLVLQQGS